ncbi:MAG: chemotaxis protein CheW [Pseudomonadales bacterium]|nr:chemotaxis protein CheW [Pseudomonadales bacterium]
MEELVDELPTFVVPLQKSSILIPNASVAEIIPYEPLQRVQGTPDWFLGFLGWRGIQVPVASFEMLTIEKASFSLVSVSSASLVVLHAIGQNSEFEYTAIVAQALPELVQLLSAQLITTTEPAARTELTKALYFGQLMSIPDFDYIESKIQGVAFSG